DADAAVNDFCRWFPQGDRRAERIVREQAAIVGHALNWKDDLVGGAIQEDRRARPPSSDHDEDVPALAHWKVGRIVAVLSDAAAVIAVASMAAACLPIGTPAAVAACAMLYHGVTLAALGSTPAVWAIHTYLNHRHPTARRANQRFLRVVRSSGH